MFKIQSDIPRNGILILLIGALLLTAAFIAGCTPDDGSGTDNATAGTSLYQIGEITGELHEEMQAVFEIIAWEGQSDAAFLINGNAILNMTDDAMDAVFEAFEHGFPIAAIDATGDQITALYGILGLRNHVFTTAASDQRIEIFAVDYDDDGDIREWIQYPPITSVAVAYDYDGDDIIDATSVETDIDDPDDQLSRVQAFRDWLEDLGDTSSASHIRALLHAHAEQNSVNLEELALMHKKSVPMSYDGSGYTLRYFILPFRHIDAEEDYFLITLEGQFNGASAYKGHQYRPVDRDTWGNGYADYFREIWTQTWIDGYADTIDAVILTHTKPDSENKTTTVTVESGFSIGGTIGISQKDGPAAEISGEFSWSEQKSFDVRDVEVYNQFNFSKAAWQFLFNQPEKDRYSMGTPEMMQPTRLSRSSFQPYMTFIFITSSAVRQTHPDGPVFVAAPKVILESSQAKSYSSTPLRKWKAIEFPASQPFTFTVPWP
jgi:hypothetical protein